MQFQCNFDWNKYLKNIDSYRSDRNQILNDFIIINHVMKKIEKKNSLSVQLFRIERLQWLDYSNWIGRNLFVFNILSINILVYSSFKIAKWNQIRKEETKKTLCNCWFDKRLTLKAPTFFLLCRNLLERAQILRLVALHFKWDIIHLFFANSYHTCRKYATSHFFILF